jgi:hypothetical protein
MYQFTHNYREKFIGLKKHYWGKVPRNFVKYSPLGPSSLPYSRRYALFLLSPAYGLHNMAYRLHNIAYGLHNIAYGLHNVAYGLHNIEYGLCLPWESNRNSLLASYACLSQPQLELGLAQLSPSLFLLFCFSDPNFAKGHKIGPWGLET